MDAAPSSDDIAILVIADGVLNFGVGARYGLGLALGKVDGARCGENSGQRFRIRTAHRDPGGTGAPTLTLSDTLFCGVDQLWLFGAEESADWDLKDSEIEAIGRFMDRGGSVFATGDHQEVGRPLCGSIPQVQWMRHWHAGEFPKVGLGNSPGRREDAQVTVWPNPLLDMVSGTEIDHEGKLVWPALFRDGGTSPALHPVFQRRNGKALRRLPDHAHEGWCADFLQWDDIPTDAKSEFSSTCFPVAIAWSVRGAVDYDGRISNRPKHYAVACAYDAHALNARRTRILTDSTWHHWTEQNIRPLRRTHWNDLKAYYRNIARWLIPRAKRETLLLAELRALVTDPQFFPNMHDEEFTSAALVGARVKAHWGNCEGPGRASEMAITAFRMVSPTFAAHLESSIGRAQHASAMHFDFSAVAVGVLGQLVAGQLAAGRQSIGDHLEVARKAYAETTRSMLNQVNEQVTSLIGMLGE